MRVLISGAGVAGSTLAYWLARYGFEPTIVERAPTLRTGGYVIDFGGPGYDVADKMGLLPEIARRGYIVQELRIVDSRGRRIAGASIAGFLRVTGGRYVTVQRGELAAALYGALENRVETIFGNSIASVDQTGARARVRFASGTERDFDLVVGADGLHSRVRTLMFGFEDRFERYLGIGVAAFDIDGYAPRDELVYILYTEVGRQVARFSMRDDQTMVLLTYLEPAGELIEDPARQRDVLRKRFQGCGWECPRLLERLDDANQFYFDRVSQIRIAPPHVWSAGRLVLVGDAASCVSLLAGEGSSLAMAAAYVLAGELSCSRGDYAVAFARYQERFGPFVRVKQRAALRFASSFAPKSRTSILIRNLAIDAMGIPGLGDLVIARMLRDDFTLPEYGT